MLNGDLVGEVLVETRLQRDELGQRREVVLLFYGTQNTMGLSHAGGSTVKAPKMSLARS